MNSTSAPQKCSALQIFEKLVLKSGVTLGRMTREEFLLTLSFASLSIPADTTVTEAHATRALQEWLKGPGQMLRIDPVELRRTLIDVCLWRRDGFGRAYAREHVAPDHPGKQYLELLNALPLEEFVADLRQGMRARRQARKEMRMDEFSRTS